MKYAVMQPYFVPYLGYWQLMSEVDVFVVYDDVQFTKQSWITRNRLMVANKPFWISLPTRKAPFQTVIKDISLASESTPIFWEKLNRTVKTNYSKAMQQEELFRWLNAMEEISSNSLNLGDFLYSQLSWIKEELGLNTELVRSSEIPLPKNLSRVEKLMEFGRILGFTSYVNAVGGSDLYSEEEFAQNGFELTFLQPRLDPYAQGRNDFVPGLSILDCVAHVPKVDIGEYIVSKS